ncbi:MAG: hypothetical protein WAW12_07365, partial [Pseudomonas sp.]
CVLVDGITGISGGRLSTRRLLNQVHELAEAAGHTHVIAHSTYNHPHTELAFIYDDDIYCADLAMKKVIAAYDVTLANEADD